MTDPWIISGVVDGLIVVVKVGEVRRPALEQAMNGLSSLGTPTLGVIINAVTREQIGFEDRFSHLHVYGYGYGYGYGEKKTEAPKAPVGPQPDGVFEIASGSNENGQVVHGGTALIGTQGPDPPGGPRPWPRASPPSAAWDSSARGYGSAARWSGARDSRPTNVISQILCLDFVACMISVS